MRTISSLAAMVLIAFTSIAETGAACGLVTLAELEAALGAKPSPLVGGAMPVAAGKPAVHICTTHTSAAQVLIRQTKSTNPASSSAAAAKGIEMMKEMGAEVQVKTFGPITCSTLIPPKGQEVMGFNTTCSIVKNGSVAAVEVTTRARKDMVPIEKLRPVAEKMATRMR